MHGEGSRTTADGTTDGATTTMAEVASTSRLILDPGSAILFDPRYRERSKGSLVPTPVKHSAWGGRWRTLTSVRVAGCESREPSAGKRGEARSQGRGGVAAAEHARHRAERRRSHSNRSLVRLHRPFRSSCRDAACRPRAGRGLARNCAGSFGLRRRRVVRVLRLDGRIPRGDRVHHPHHVGLPARARSARTRRARNPDGGLGARDPAGRTAAGKARSRARTNRPSCSTPVR